MICARLCTTKIFGSRLSSKCSIIFVTCIYLYLDILLYNCFLLFIYKCLREIKKWKKLVEPYGLGCSYFASYVNVGFHGLSMGTMDACLDMYSRLE